MTRAAPKPGELQQSLPKRFRRRVARDRILSTVRTRQYFVPRSEERRIAHHKAVRRKAGVSDGRSGGVAGKPWT